MGVARTRGRPWMRLRNAILDEDPLCVRCLAEGRTVAGEEVDHIVPLHQGGTDVRHNLQVLCSTCHAEKTRAEMRDTHRQGCTVDGLPRWRARKIDTPRSA